jgi:hypothetical protein
MRAADRGWRLHADRRTTKNLVFRVAAFNVASLAEPSATGMCQSFDPRRLKKPLLTVSGAVHSVAHAFVSSGMQFSNY